MKTKAEEACERAVVKAAMDRKNHDGTWSHAGPRVEVLDILCDRLLAARERAKTKKAKGSP